MRRLLVPCSLFQAVLIAGLANTADPVDSPTIYTPDTAEVHTLDPLKNDNFIWVRGPGAKFTVDVASRPETTDDQLMETPLARVGLGTFQVSTTVEDCHYVPAPPIQDPPGNTSLEVNQQMEIYLETSQDAFAAGTYLCEFKTRTLLLRPGGQPTLVVAEAELKLQITWAGGTVSTFFKSPDAVVRVNEVAMRDVKIHLCQEKQEHDHHQFAGNATYESTVSARFSWEVLAGHMVGEANTDDRTAKEAAKEEKEAAKQFEKLANGPVHFKTQVDPKKEDKLKTTSAYIQHGFHGCSAIK